MNKKLPDLVIGDLKINPPIIQGGMGVRISTASLVAAVSNEGAFGVIASVGLGEEYSDASHQSMDYKQRSNLALAEQISATKKKTNKPFGVNIMCALTNYDDLVRVCEENKVSAIISGAGLPLKLPSLVESSEIKLIPIVSSGRAAAIICESWKKRYHRIPDALIVEGPLAGGHLGFSLEELKRIDEFDLKKLVSDVLQVARQYGNMPVIAAGGIFTGYDIAEFLRLGASGVQMATRFIATEECDVAPAFKEAFLKCRKEDIVIIKSPVGLPGRVIKNKFVERTSNAEHIPFECSYQCLRTCNPETSPYCIAKALLNAYRGNLDSGFAMCGANAYRIKEIVSVKHLIDELVSEASSQLS